MNRFFVLCWTVVCCLFFAACNDEPTQIDPSCPPVDAYEGTFKKLTLGAETESLHADSALCYLLYDDEAMFSRKCRITKIGNKTVVQFEKGLDNGIYRLLYFEYEVERENGEKNVEQYGMGCRILFYKNIAKVLDAFDKTLRMSGSGTADDPYIISCAPHLYNLTLDIGDFYEYENFIGAHFKQVADISLKDASYYCKHESGWIPIGNRVYPFVGTYDGDGHKISNMYSYQDQMCGVGLFGHISKSTIMNVIVENADIYGVVGVGGIAGCMMSLTGERTTSYIENCHVRNSAVKGCKDGFSIGGVVGLIDMYTIGAVAKCQSVSNTLEGEYNVGGIVGGSSAYSMTSIDLCENSSSVTCNYAGAGGIIGVADTLSVTTSTNRGKVTGAVKYNGGTNTMGRGVGGICGGAGVSYFSGCENQAAVEGYEGVGGVVGSTRLSDDLFNSTYLRYCMNDGSIKAKDKNVGGLCGESQFGCFGSINNGNVQGKDYVGGIVGFTSLSLVHNSMNKGEIKGTDYVAGISAKSDMGVYAVCQNYGEIKSSGSMSAGIVGLTGNNTAIHYCANFGAISGQKSPTGGIVGEIGDPREWSATNITEVVFGSVETVLSFMGPAFALIEHFAPGAKLALKVTELAVEGLLKIPTTVLWGIGVNHLNNPHHIETLLTSIEEEMGSRVERCVAKLDSARLTAGVQINEPFSSEPMAEYAKHIVNLSSFLIASDENNERFNERINEVMHERAEEIQLDNENKQTIYTIVGAISLVTTTACAIAATVASGGTAGFIAAGTIAGVVGGINSICAGAADYTDNVIILSQCVNAADISCKDISDDKVGGLAGRIHDRGLIYDCLNTGNGPQNSGGDLVGSIGKDYDVSKSLSISSGDDAWDGLFGEEEVSLSESEGLVSYTQPLLQKMADATYFKGLGWNIGSDDSHWMIPKLKNGNSFPVPFTSEMVK